MKSLGIEFFMICRHTRAIDKQVVFSIVAQISQVLHSGTLRWFQEQWLVSFYFFFFGYKKGWFRFRS